MSEILIGSTCKKKTPPRGKEHHVGIIEGVSGTNALVRWTGTIDGVSDNNKVIKMQGTYRAWTAIANLIIQ